MKAQKINEDHLLAAAGLMSLSVDKFVSALRGDRRRGLDSIKAGQAFTELLDMKFAYDTLLTRLNQQRVVSERRRKR